MISSFLFEYLKNIFKRQSVFFLHCLLDIENLTYFINFFQILLELRQMSASIAI